MDSSQILCSDDNRCAYGADFLKLARELDIPEDLLKFALDDTADFLREWSPSNRPAKKKDICDVARSLTKAIEQLSKTGVRERLTTAVSEEPEEPDADDAAYYFAWLAAKHRVDHAIDGALDLLKIVKCAETINFRPGRPQYDRWLIAIKLLLGIWTDELGRGVTISGHPSDPRGVKPSDTVRYVHQSMWLIGEEINEQACRTILQNIKKEGDNFGMDLNQF